MAASEIWENALDAMWQAIDQKSELNADGESEIQSKYKFETNADCLAGPVPAYSDLNAISIWPATINQEFYDHRTKRFPVVFRIDIWTREWILKDAFRTWMNVMTAIFEERDENEFPDANNGMNTYIKQATGLYPRVESVSMNRERSGSEDNTGAFVADGRAIRTEARIVIPTTKDIYPR